MSKHRHHAHQTVALGSCLAGLLLVMSCRQGARDVPTAPGATPDVPTAAPPARASMVRIYTDTSVLFVGAERSISLEAYDAASRPVSTEGAGVVSTDPSVVLVSGATVIPVRDVRTGITWQSLVSRVRMVGPGSAWVRVTLDGAADSVLFRTGAAPRSASSLIVESFSVVEYRVTCAWACPYLAYAPLLKLRATGSGNAEVVAVEFTMEGRTTGLCAGSVRFTPGLVGDVNRIDAYLWNNDLMFVSLGGVPLPGDVATAHAVVREADGGYSQIDVIGPVQRGFSYPVLPMTTGGASGWACY